MSVNSKMTAIADAIRNLLDISGTMGLDAMASNISSITKRGAVAGTISTKSEQYIIPAGYHNGNGYVGISSAEQEKLIAENIKNGVTILGVSGTASGDIYAIITVTYPEGSICTCYDGTTTIPARDTSGKALFNVPIGEWTVSCTKGSNSKSTHVSITAEGQIVSVTLDYTLYIFKSGSGLQEGFTVNTLFGCSGYSKSDKTKITMTGGQHNVMSFSPSVDLSKYSKIYFEISGGSEVYVGASSSATSWQDTYGPAGFDIYKLVKDSTRKTVELDISSVTSSKYIKIHFVLCSGYAYNIYFG